MSVQSSRGQYSAALFPRVLYKKGFYLVSVAHQLVSVDFSMRSLIGNSTLVA